MATLWDALFDRTVWNSIPEFTVGELGISHPELFVFELTDGTLKHLETLRAIIVEQASKKWGDDPKAVEEHHLRSGFTQRFEGVYMPRI